MDIYSHCNNNNNHHHLSIPTSTQMHLPYPLVSIDRVMVHKKTHWFVVLKCCLCPIMLFLLRTWCINRLETKPRLKETKISLFHHLLYNTRPPFALHMKYHILWFSLIPNGIRQPRNTHNLFPSVIAYTSLAGYIFHFPEEWEEGGRTLNDLPLLA